MESEDREKLIKLGNFIQNKRQSADISAYYIEKKFDINRSLWSRLENGKLSGLPKPAFLKKIALILNINYLTLYKLIGYISNKDVIEYVSEIQGVRNNNRVFENFKP